MKENAAAIGVERSLQRPLKPWCCGQNHNCRPQFRTMFIRNVQV